ncbi:MAG: hypothetical protein C4541_02910 [Candidatus Auribacter fodinae]|jgi:hypothetical protein|uniref:Glycosyltransferase RgtA/B/C/D-like domain-containing protein n=1 Tax=Candidatus Auribacter fodinae TaxID=2093366 RepID=A0A3A4RF73_9BACT|nr:MAG: hypothetical protein C4541_02910 [Candidatus Auribacter fodinae]
MIRDASKKIEYGWRWLTACGAGLLVIANIVLIWQYTFIPFQDHPSHLLREKVVLHYDNPRYDFSSHFDLNIKPVPNILSDICVVLLGYIVPLHTASKIFYSLYIVLFPLAYLWFLRGISKEKSAYALLAVFFTYSYYACMGNENFLLSLILFFFLWGIVVRNELIQSVRWQWLIFVFAVLLYFAHMFTFYIALVSMPFYCFVRYGLRRCLIVFCHFILPVVLFFVWQSHEGGTVGLKEGGFKQMLITRQKLEVLISSFSPYLNCNSSRIMYGAGGALLVLVAAGMRFRDKTVSAGSITFLVIFLHLFFPTTFMFYGPDQRAVFLAVLFGGILIPSAGWIRMTFVTALIAGSAVSFSINRGYFRDTNAEMRPIVAALSKIPPARSVLPVVFPPYVWNFFSHRIFEYYHILSGGMNPYHFFTSSNIVKYKTEQESLSLFNTDPSYYPPELLKRYDVVTVIGDTRDTAVRNFIGYLRERGFGRVEVRSATVNAFSMREK